MSLEKTEKTIPLHGGIQEDADGFLFEEPNMAYVENGVFVKQGVISKVPPTNTSASAPSDIFYGDGVVGDKAICLTQTGTAIWDKATDNWDENTSQDNYTVAKVATGDQTYNGVHMGGGEFFDGSSLLVTETFSPKAGTHLIHVQTFDTEGALVFSEKFRGRTPKVTTAGNTTATYAVWWVNELTNALQVRAINVSGWAASASSPLDGSNAANRVETDGWQFTNPDATNSSWADSGSFYRGHVRLSMTQNACDNGQYEVCSAGQGLNDLNFVAAKCQDGEIRVLKTNTVLGTTSILATGIQDGAGGDVVGVLDIQINPEDAGYSPWVLYVESSPNGSTSPQNSTVSALKINGVAFTVGGTTTVETTTGSVVRGAVCPNSDSTVVYSALTLLGANERYQFGVKLPIARTVMVWYQDSSATRIEYARIPVSKMTIDNTRGKLFLVTNTWETWHPEGSSSISVGVQRQGSAPAAVKGRTDSLYSYDIASNSINIVATYLAGTGKFSPAAMVESDPWHNNLYYDEDTETITYCGRQLVVEEDMYVFVEDTFPVASALDANNRMNEAFGFGIARGVLLKSKRVDGSIRVPCRANGRSVYFGTARPIVASGNGISPISFPGVPEINHVDSSGNAGFPFSTTYNSIVGSTNQAQMYVIAGYVDGNGQVYRSSPGTLVYSDGVDFDDLPNAAPIIVTVAVPPLETDREIFVELYVGQKLTEPLLVSTTQEFGTTFVSASFTPFVETSGGFKQNISGTRAGYTSGGQLGVDPWPCFRDITFTSNRMWTIPVEFDGVVQYSKLLEENVAPEFNGALNISFGSDRKIECVETLDDKVVVFERDRIHYINGTGPDNFGQGDFVVQLISADVGCDDPESVVETPDGLMFFSAQTQEFHLLSRNLEIIDVGKPVQDLSSNITDIKAGVLSPENHEVRFIVTGSGTDILPVGDSGVGVKAQPPRPRVGRSLPASVFQDPTLVYNYRMKKWSVIQTVIANDAMVVGREFTLLSGTFSSLVYEDASIDTSLVRMRLETPWVKLSELQSYGRVYQINLLGRYLSSWTDDGSGGWIAGDLQVTLLYDYEENGTQHVYRWRAQQDLNAVGRDNLQVKIRPGRQKAQSVKLVIEEIPTTKVEVSEPTYTLGRGFELSGIQLVYGMKGPDYKTVPTRRAK